MYIYYVVQAVEEAEAVIRKVLSELSDPDLGGATCSPAFLLGRTKSSLDVIDSVTDSFSIYNNDPSCEYTVYCYVVGSCNSVLYVYVCTAMGKALSSLSTYTHSMSEVVLLGVATSHLAPAEEGKSKSLSLSWGK